MEASKWVKEDADKTFELLKAYTKRVHTFNRTIDIKVSCSYYCSIKTFALKTKQEKEHWINVSKYIQKKY